MGANQSTEKTHKKTRIRQDATNTGGDVVRGQRQEVFDPRRRQSENYRRSGEGEDLYDNNCGLLRDNIKTATDQQHDSDPSTTPELPARRNQLVSNNQKPGVSQTSTQPVNIRSEREDKPKESPALIKRTPEEVNHSTSPSQYGNNMNTIKQAKVNVKDKISFFKETNAPIIPDKTKKPQGYRRSEDISNQPDIVQHTQPVNILAPNQNHSSHQASSAEGLPRTSLPLKSESPNKHRDSHIEDKTPELPRRLNKLPVTTTQSKSSENRRTPHTAYGHKKSSTTPNILNEEDFQRIEPEVDYDLDLPGDEGSTTNNNKTSYQRMNTLEYFKQVPRENSILRGFEKAKPAGRHRKPKGPSRAPRRHSMFPAQQSYGSDPDLVGISDADSADSMEFPGDSIRLTEQEKLATINRHGQKYAMDDTAYETLSRRKKIAGQRLAIGVVDKKTEKNFLLSLKRNVQFKHARIINIEDEETDGLKPQQDKQHVRLSEMVF